jgi:hypothetical protein
MLQSAEEFIDARRLSTRQVADPVSRRRLSILAALGIEADTFGTNDGGSGPLAGL